MDDGYLKKQLNITLDDLKSQPLATYILVDRHLVSRLMSMLKMHREALLTYHDHWYTYETCGYLDRRDEKETNAALAASDPIAHLLGYK